MTTNNIEAAVERIFAAFAAKMPEAIAAARHELTLWLAEQGQVVTPPAPQPQPKAVPPVKPRVVQNVERRDRRAVTVAAAPAPKEPAPIPPVGQELMSAIMAGVVFRQGESPVDGFKVPECAKGRTLSPHWEAGEGTFEDFCAGLSQFAQEDTEVVSHTRFDLVVKYNTGPGCYAPVLVFKRLKAGGLSLLCWYELAPPAQTAVGAAFQEAGV